MDFLRDTDFTENAINYLVANTPKLFQEELEKEKNIVLSNINYLKELGIEHYDEIFKNYYDMFLIDPSSFASIFNKYDKEDLIEKLNKNITIVEHL